MVDLYYLDDFRGAVADVEAASKINAETVEDAEELMRESKMSMKALAEHTAKLMLDLAFLRIASITDNDAAKERLTRYAGALYCKAKSDYDV